MTLVLEHQAEMELVILKQNANLAMESAVEVALQASEFVAFVSSCFNFTFYNLKNLLQLIVDVVK